MEYLLLHDVTKVLYELDRSIPWWRNLSEARQQAIANMCFQLGIGRLLKFKTMLGRLENLEYGSAADAAKNSLWARQTPARARRVIKMIRDG